jgi:peptidoglycan/xylan/chitin deacetylase (PgdA/CDA1 family)
LRLFERLDRRRPPGPRCTVVSYHRIADEEPGYRDIAVSPSTFREHLSYLQRRGFAFVSLEQYTDYLSGTRALERDSVLVTFDDGYRDNYSAAFPVLRELGIPAAVFLCTGPIDTGELLWWDRVAGAMRSLFCGGIGAVTWGPGMDPELAEVLSRGLSGDARRASNAIADVVDLLKQLPADERERIVREIEHGAPGPQPRDLMLTWDMVREMHAAGIAFGAHSVTHPAFSRIGADAAEAEIHASKRAIEENLGTTVTAFAYPYGKTDYFDPATVAALRAAGFRWAFTTENGWNDSGTDPLALRRDGMRDVPAYVLAARIAGVFEHPLLARLRSRIEGHSTSTG